MTFVVTEACVNCKHTDCVDVCPTEAFHEGENFLVINPDECIDCALCIAECPVNAIYKEDELPDEQAEFLQINADLSRRWPVILEKKSAMGDAEAWEKITQKRHLIVAEPCTADES